MNNNCCIRLCRSVSFVRCLFPDSPAGKPYLRPLADDRIVPQPLTETYVQQRERKAKWELTIQTPVVKKEEKRSRRGINQWGCMWSCKKQTEEEEKASNVCPSAELLDSGAAVKERSAVQVSWADEAQLFLLAAWSKGDGDSYSSKPPLIRLQICDTNSKACLNNLELWSHPETPVWNQRNHF